MMMRRVHGCALLGAAVVVWLTAPGSYAVVLAEDAGPSAAPVLALDECVANARARQPKLAQVRSDLAAAQARLRQAWSAVLPRVGAAASATYADISGGSGSGGLTTQGGSEAFSVTAKQVLWDFGRSLARLKQGRAEQEAARWQELSTTQATVLTVTQAYLTALEAQEAARVAEQALDLAAQQRERTRKFADVGLRSPADVSTAETAYAQAAFARLKARDTAERAKHALNEAMGGRSDTAYRVQEPPALTASELSQATLEAALTRAIAQRTELRRAASLEESADAQMRAARDNWWPTLSASGGYAGRHNDSSDLTNTWSATLNASWDVWDSGLTAAQTAEARAKLRRARAEQEEQTLTVTREVQDAWFGVREFTEHVQVAEHLVAAASERLKLTAARYATGLSSTLDVTDASQTLTVAQQALLSARTDAYLAYIQFRYALGEEL